jgi:hypothetical protein
MDDELTTLELLETGGTLLDEGAELATLDELEEGVPPVQAAPFTVGRSTVPPLVTPWKPNSTVWPGGIVPFQPRLVAA